MNFRDEYNSFAGTAAVTAENLENRIVQDDPQEVIMDRNVPLLQFVEYWLENYKKNTVKPSTYNRLAVSAKALGKYSISSTPIGNINLFVLQGYVNDLVHAGYSVSTIKKQTEIVTAPLKIAAAMQILPTDPTVGVKTPSKAAVQKKTKKIMPYNNEEQRKLCDALATRQRSSFPTIELFLELGVRPGEMLALKWSDADFDRRRLRVHATIVHPELTAGSIYQNSPKSDSSNRVVPLTDKAIALLHELESHSTSEWVNDFRGHRLSYQSLSRHAKFACELAGIEYRALHVFRHTFATNCYYKGMDIKILSKVLGHATVDITYNTYIDLYGDGFDEMLKAMTAV